MTKMQRISDWYNRYPMFIAGWALMIDAVIVIQMRQNDWESQGATLAFLGMLFLWLREVNLRLIMEPFGGAMLSEKKGSP